MKFVLRKLAGLLAATWFTATLTFFALYILPGDPALLILGTEADPQSLRELQMQLGLNQPIGVRYLQWLRDLLGGDFGVSLRYSRPVGQLLAQALPVTLGLAVLAVAAALFAALPLGVFTAVAKPGVLPRVVETIAHLGMAVPSFWVGVLLMQWLAVDRAWFPAGGFFFPRQAGWGAAITSLVLPVTALAIPRAAILVRMIRSSMIDVLHQDYIRTARSKGVPARIIYFRHGLRNAALNVATVAAVQLTQLLAGTIIIEQVFSLPGLGRLLLAAVMQRDFPLVQGLVVVIAGLIVIFHYGFDILLGLLDPRIRFD